MKKMFSAFLMLCLLLSCSCAAFADQTYRIPVCELYSVDGYYEDCGSRRGGLVLRLCHPLRVRLTADKDLP